MDNLTLLPITKIPVAKLDLPGSKSIANRVLPLAALSVGVSIIHNVPSDAEDVSLMLQALKTLGISVTEVINQANTINTSSYQIQGCGGNLPVDMATIFCGNSGTSIRFLTAMLALMPGWYRLTGIERMYERPIKDLVDALLQLGARVDYEQNSGFPPLHTHPFMDNMVDTIRLSGKMSSQYLTGVLMALPLLGRALTVEIYDELISKPYVTITRELLAKFGCNIASNGNTYFIPKQSKLSAIDYTVEPDASSASYFLAMGALAGNITVNHLSQNSLQGDKNFAGVLARMGANVSYLDDQIRVEKGVINPIDINMEDMPDVAMTIAIMALFACGTSTIRGIHSWKVKETDRLSAMQNELSKLGAQVSITDSSITITPPLQIKPDMEIDTYNDHRMAMCFSLIAVGGIPVTIKNYRCVNKTFPQYFEVFKRICY